MAERPFDSENYRYTVGMYKTFNSANQLKDDLVKQGVGDAFVVPYMNGLRLSENEIALYAEVYPDLKNLVEAAGN